MPPLETGPLRAVAALASPLWAVTNAVARVAARGRARRLPVPVISVGNILAGGVGKTELAAAIANRLIAEGRRVVVASRGYRSSWEARGAVAHDWATAASLGFPDESLVVLKKAPGVAVAVGRDRRATLERHWEELSPEIVILDDGLQHFPIARDLDVVAHDFSIRLPVLRDLPRYLKTAGARVSFSAVPNVWSSNGGAPWVRARYALKGAVDASGASRSLPGEALVFCGIGNPDRVRRGLEERGTRVVALKTFADHAAYDAAGARGLARWKQESENARGRPLPLLTTLKDFVKLGSFVESQGGVAGFEPLWIDIKLELTENENALWNAIAGVAGKKS
jgi:tetraacyldisaccharide 4'-kinase